MRWLVLLSLISQMAFSAQTNECIRSNFEVSINKPGAFWGMFPYKMLITKNRCEVSIYRKNILETSWKVDLCREPIHIKAYQYFTHKDVLKMMNCSSKSKDTYCRKKDELLSILEKEGLVHVKGERENFNSEHGKLHCLNSLMQRYLSKFEILSMTKDYEYKPVVKVQEKVHQNKAPVMIRAEDVKKLHNYVREEANKIEDSIGTQEKLEEF